LSAQAPHERLAARAAHPLMRAARLFVSNSQRQGRAAFQIHAFVILNDMRAVQREYVNLKVNRVISSI